ncbi:hypothetical protein VCHA40P242_20553 [Vibrio chagasii]|nr:hypothetical protein VCHA36P164_10188 [Vibrio chagasii]CAH7170782.1 hypothetical protein VCHA40P242_20553 [Vibrio chagasii]CAK3750395.1 hypothetical protein VCRA2120E8_160027 [Vibrio crassostreae]
MINNRLWRLVALVVSVGGNLIAVSHLNGAFILSHTLYALIAYGFR